ncbi:MAG: NUDIX domain-containing protein [Acetobacteraceae bacterium]|nr:NUDIX domain-containing protein [Acetobacteraceae bacterium]
MSDATPKPPAPARPAATVLLVRDAPEGMEIFMVVRHHQIEFASGALVFPGGRVEEGDQAIAARVAPALPGGSFRIAGIRETFEECGVLLAHDEAGRLVGAERLLAVEAAHRQALCAGSKPFAEVLAEERLAPIPEAMLPFAHWITPSDLPKRFDTHFFLAEAPPDQLAAHDGGESVDSVWIRPADALADAEAGRRTVLFPTRKNLERLARFGTVGEAMAATREHRVVSVQPEIVTLGDGTRWLKIPEEAGYGGSLFPVGMRAM